MILACQFSMCLKPTIAGDALPDLHLFLEQLQIMPATLEHILHQNNARLFESLQVGFSAFPNLISRQTADAVQASLAPRIEGLPHEISGLNDRIEKILTILKSLTSTTPFSLKSGAEPPLQMFVSSLISELVEEGQALRQAVTGLGITKPWIFESTPANTQTLEESYLQKVGVRKTRSQPVLTDCPGKNAPKSRRLPKIRYWLGNCSQIIHLVFNII